MSALRELLTAYAQTISEEMRRAHRRATRVDGTLRNDEQVVVELTEAEARELWQATSWCEQRALGRWTPRPIFAAREKLRRAFDERARLRDAQEGG